MNRLIITRQLVFVFTLLNFIGASKLTARNFAPMPVEPIEKREGAPAAAKLEVTVTVQFSNPTVIDFVKLMPKGLDPQIIEKIDVERTSVTQPVGAEAKADPISGDVVYTPGSLFSPPLRPEGFGDFEVSFFDEDGKKVATVRVRIGGIIARGTNPDSDLAVEQNTDISPFEINFSNETVE